MDKNRRKELQEEFRQIKTYMGIFQITNKVDGKIYIDSCPNLKNKWLTLQFQLENGQLANAELQSDWKRMGAEAFEYKVLEQKDAGEVTDKRWELKQMLNLWLEKLQPYGDRGYNKSISE